MDIFIVIVVNPSLLNPDCIKVSYFNCQGLIPFRELGKENPELDVTKINEIRTFLECQNDA